MTWAQGQGRDPMRPGRPEGNPGPRAQRPAAEKVTISGSLTVAHGSPAVKSGDETYLITGIHRLLGFVDGLKEGAQVTIEGSTFTSRQDSGLKFLRPAKLTLNGKNYDLTPLASPFGLHRQFSPPPGGLYRHQPPAPQQRQQRQFNRPNENKRQGRPRTL